MHLLETPYQRAWAWREYGWPWAVELDRQGILGPNVSLAHAVWTDDAELICMAERGVTVCHNPSSNLRLKSGLAPVPRMRARGVRVALGGTTRFWAARKTCWQRCAYAPISIVSPVSRQRRPVRKRSFLPIVLPKPAAC
jgi:hypothetical protein